jgi:hypothetical protein
MPLNPCSLFSSSEFVRISAEECMLNFFDFKKNEIHNCRYDSSTTLQCKRTKIAQSKFSVRIEDVTRFTKISFWMHKMGFPSAKSTKPSLWTFQRWILFNAVYIGFLSSERCFDVSSADW